MRSKPFGYIVPPEEDPSFNKPKPINPQETIPVPLPQAPGLFTPGLYTVVQKQESPEPGPSRPKPRQRLHPFKRYKRYEKSFALRALANHKGENPVKLPVILCYNQEQVKITVKEEPAPEPSLVTEYLRYAYSTNDKDLEVEVARLFILDDPQQKQFRVRELINACKESILRAVTKTNALSVYSSGEQLKSGIITDTCFDFIKKNKKEIWNNEKEFQKACEELPSLMYKLLVE